MADSLKLNNFCALSTEKERRSIRACITKIMNTLSFRKLAGKTQVILSLTGPDVRTRLTHTIEVAKIAKDICIDLDLNEELAEAMALAHDIGHTPFGHVGERTLREVMCGCDTLGDKVRDCDFDNSGFKHNLQSFRVLTDLEGILNNSNGEVEYEKIWPYIIWGALAHTKMTYAKAYSGMDDEIFISSKHCDWVYVCYYDEKKECKRNIQKKKRKEKNRQEICKPWYCAMIPVIEDRDEVDEKDLNKNETTIEYIKKEPIKNKYLERIYCSHKCYLAKLWRHKIEQKSIYEKYPYLFDHSFPNSFYAVSLNNYFSKSDDENDLGYISFEAQIVGQADEIAQRQQDLEDGINKGLLPFEKAKEEVQFLIAEFDCTGKFKVMIDAIDMISNSKDLGKLLTEFYKKAIIDQTLQNVTDFISNEDKVVINIYSLMNILYSMENDKKKKEKWILKEFESLKVYSGCEKQEKIECLEDYFEIDFHCAYLYLLSYDYLEKCSKSNEYSEDTIEIMFKCINLFNEMTGELTETKAELTACQEILQILKNSSGSLDFAYHFIKTLNLLRDYLCDYFGKESADFFKNNNQKWKNIGWLKLRAFYALYQINKERIENNNGQIISISDLKQYKIPAKYNPTTDAVTSFYNWKNTLKGDANKVLANLVTFTDKNNHGDNREKALNDFKENQSNTILKSEPVEKNDGKANYILRRLFKAYVTNSHQLPDLGLKYILISLIKEEKLAELMKSEKHAIKEILAKLEKTMIKKTKTNNELKEIWETDLLNFKTEDEEFKRLNEGKSSEIKAALEKRKKLSDYLKQLSNSRSEIIQKLNSEKEQDRDSLKEQLRNLRAILDNSILNKTPYWESIMTRGICDYIASLTDQEAITEYEKLYAGIMELV